MLNFIARTELILKLLLILLDSDKCSYYYFSGHFFIGAYRRLLTPMQSLYGEP